MIAAVPVAEAGTYDVIHRFETRLEGALPLDGVVTYADGNLYGTTSYGGASNDCGTVYRLARPVPGGESWTYKVLLNVGTNDGACHPSAAPALKGNTLFGTTTTGLTPGSRYGTVFRLRIDPERKIFETLHAFDDIHGANPTSVTPGPDGTLFGTTLYGGSLDESCPLSDRHQGVLYKLAPDGSFQILHAFGHNTGTQPDGDLIFGPDGALYGTTLYRCADPANHGNGIVFRLPLGGRFSVVYRFGQTDAVHSPSGRMVFGADGTLYGTAFGGSSYVYGVVWSLKPSTMGEPWDFHYVLNFKKQPSGSLPNGLVWDETGNLYGTALKRGAFGFGVLYRLSQSGKSWTETLLHDFGADPSDGTSPNRNLILVGGVLYGTTNKGSGSGTIFRYSLN